MAPRLSCAAAVLDVDAGDAIEDLGLVLGAEIGDVVGADARDAGGRVQRIARSRGGRDDDVSRRHDVDAGLMISSPAGRLSRRQWRRAAATPTG